MTGKVEVVRVYKSGDTFGGQVPPHRPKREDVNADLADALADVLRILEAVRYTAGLGNKQMERVKKARAILARARGESQ